MRYSALLMGAFCCMIAGCVVDGPLSDPATADLDEQLLGHWTAKDKERKHIRIDLFIGKHTQRGNPKSIMEFLWIEYDLRAMEIHHPGAQHGYFSVTTLGKMKLINVFGYAGSSAPADLSRGGYATWAKQAKRSCAIYRYEIDGKQLVLSPDNVDKFVKSGDLRKDEEGRVPASSLVTLLRKTKGKGLFREGVIPTFRKVE